MKNLLITKEIILKKVLSFIIIFLNIVFLSAASYKVQAYVDKTTVGLQDRLSFTVEISGDNANGMNRPDLPDIEGFDFVGQNESQSSSYSIINGKMEASVSFKFIYYLQPQKKGLFVIPAIRTEIDNRTYRTKPIQVKVIEGTTAKLQPKTPQNPFQSRGQRAQNTQNNSSNLSDNVILETELDKKEAFLGEVIIANVVLYTRYEITNIQYGDSPSYTDFWKEELYSAEHLKFEGAVYKGRNFNKILLNSIALIPTETGQLDIPRVSFDVDIRTRSNDFFSFGRTKRYTITANPKKIRVKPLPAPQPNDFTGAIGRFTMTSDLSNDQVKVGDSFTYTLTIRGTGNLKNFEPPLLPEIKNLRFIKPEIKTTIDDSYRNVSGTKQIKYLVIPEEKGNYFIPEINFTYFSPTQKKYITLNTPPKKVEASAGEQINFNTAIAKNMVTAEGQDIAFINTEIDFSSFSNPFESIYYWLIYIFVLLTIPVTIVFASKQEYLNQNKNLLRSRKANKILKKYLKKATVNANLHNPDFYVFAQTGIKNFITDKLDIPRGAGTNEILEKMKTDSLFADSVSETEDFLKHCDEVRFMPGGFSKENISNDYQRLTHLIKQLSRR